MPVAIDGNSKFTEHPHPGRAVSTGSWTAWGNAVGAPVEVGTR